MYKNLLALFFILLLPLLLQAQADSISVSIDLSDQRQNTLVEIRVPDWPNELLVYTIPIVQYANYDAVLLRDLITNIEALDAEGNELPHSFSGKTGIEIRQASRLATLRYQVQEQDAESKTFAASSSLRASDGSQIFNHNNYYGYFEQYREVPYELRLKIMAGLHPSTNLNKLPTSEEYQVRYQAKDYYELFDHPILIAEPDTASIRVKGRKLNISCYSSNKLINAQELADRLEPLIESIHEMIAIPPPEDYAFLFYFTGPEDSPGSGHQFGGKMHSNSSLYVLPEINARNQRYSLIRRMIAHEYLHLLSPYHLRSHNMEHLNFVNSPMSRHLWFYEGAIEYFSLRALYKSDNLTEEEFLSELSEKIMASRGFKKGSLAQISEMIFKKKNQEQFKNFYYRGALAAFGMDLLIREQSNGENTLLQVVNKLCDRYGPDNPFYDGDFIKEIAKESTPSVQNFYDEYIEGKRDLPYTVFAKSIGYEYFDETLSERCYIGEFTLKVNARNGKVFFMGVRKNGLKVENSDYLALFQGQLVTEDNYKDIEYQLNKPANNEQIQLRVIRDGQPIELSGRPICSIEYKRDAFLLPSQANEQQKTKRAQFFDR